MAKRAHAYPQVEPGAAGIVNVALGTAPAAIRAAEALGLARTRNLGLVDVGEEAFVLREDLARAAALGLGDLAARELARPLPLVDAFAPEVSVRRWLAAGAPAVVVRDRRGPMGAVSAARGRPDAGPSLRLDRSLPAAGLAVLAAASRVAAMLGARAYLVGGAVRDAVGERSRTGTRQDLDLVIEGNGLKMARALAAELGPGVDRDLVEHEWFLTASFALPGGGRVDVATARSERYDTPGALPRVMPATIGQDLERRDFTINAMAVELESGRFGLLDPFGGRRDLGRRRLRILHPLSFVEDPTRIFRAARYAARLGLALDGWTARCQTLALRLGPYPALSGQRLAAELELILGEPGPEAALGRLGRAGAFGLLDPRYRFTRRTAARLGALGPTLAWTRSRSLRVVPLELAALVLLADQRREVARVVPGRLGLSGEPLARVERALARTDAPPAPLDERPSRGARWVRQVSDLELAWRWLEADAAGRVRLDRLATLGREVHPELRGDEVIALGVRRGPEVGRVLEALRDARLDGVVADRDGEAEFVRQWVAREQEG